MDKALMNGSLRYELEMACNFTQLVLFRPFLHYLRVIADRRAISLAESWHALACIKLASSTVLRSAEMTASCPDLALSWELVYTLFLAIICLIFLISAHNGTSQPSEAWRRATVGIQTLMANACVDDGASSCLKVIKVSRSRMPQLQLNVLMNCKGSCPAAQSYR